MDCPEFQTVVEIFQVEVQNVVDGVGYRDIVPFELYDSSVLVVNQAPFPRSESNTPEKETATPKDEEVKEVSNEDSLSQLFTSVDNGPTDEEEPLEDEFQMFHQRETPYNLRNRQVGSPFTTFTLPNNFSTLPDPNASNNPGYPHVPTQYFNKNRQSS